MNQKVLSVSVAAYNAAGDLPRCIESFAESAVFSDIELLIVNDGSKDNTLEVAKEYQDKYPASIKVIDKPNGGHGSTINRSIVESTGKYFKVVDSDDWVEVDGIERLVEYLKHTEVDLILNPFYSVSANNMHKELTSPIEGNKWESSKIMQFDGVCGDITLIMHSITLKTSILKNIGPVIDENCFYVDMEYTVFPVPYIDTVVLFDYPVYDYLLGTATQSMNTRNLITRREQHLRVTKRLLEHQIEDKASHSKELLIRKRAAGAINMQLYIYYMMGSASKSEMMQFDRYLEDNFKELYLYAFERGEKRRLKYISIMKWQKKTGFVFYSVTMKILSSIRSIKNKLHKKK